MPLEEYITPQKIKRSIDDKIFLIEGHKLEKIEGSTDALFSNLNKSVHPPFLIIVLEKRDNLGSLGKKIESVTQFCKMVLLVPCNMQLDLEEVHRLLRSFLKENKNDNYSVISAISQGSSISKFRSLDSLRAALRVLGKFGVPKIGSIVEVRCSDSVQNRELSYMASMMREFLGNRKLKIFVKKDEKKDSFRVTLINVGICLDEQIDMDLDLFQMEPECRMERKLNLDLPISNILE